MLSKLCPLFVDFDKLASSVPDPEMPSIQRWFEVLQTLKRRARLRSCVCPIPTRCSSQRSWK